MCDSWLAFVCCILLLVYLYIQFSSFWLSAVMLVCVRNARSVGLSRKMSIVVLYLPISNYTIQSTEHFIREKIRRRRFFSLYIIRVRHWLPIMGKFFSRWIFQSNSHLHNREISSYTLLLRILSFKYSFYILRGLKFTRSLFVNFYNSWVEK